MKMKRLLLPTIFLGGAVSGAALDDHLVPPKDADAPAYLIGAATITDFDNLPEYRAQAEPLARKGGYIVIASGDTEQGSAKLLEGEWPAIGLIFIERYDSMDDLMTFAKSDEFKNNWRHYGTAWQMFIS